MPNNLSMKKSSENHPIERAISIAGGISAMARSLGVSAPTVHQWKSGGRQVPAERCPEIERITNGAVTCEELRPDLVPQWAYLRSTSKEKAA